MAPHLFIVHTKANIIAPCSQEGMPAHAFPATPRIPVPVLQGPCEKKHTTCSMRVVHFGFPKEKRLNVRRERPCGRPLLSSVWFELSLYVQVHEQWSRHREDSLVYCSSCGPKYIEALPWPFKTLVAVSVQSVRVFLHD